MNFCPKCGTRLTLEMKGRDQFGAVCRSCGFRVEDVLKDGPAPARESTPLLRSFPYKSMRPFQKEVLEKIQSAVSSGKKFIILEAPVGFGKSAVAATLCRHFNSGYVLTSTKQLQEQYSADFGFATVMGKSNFTCYVPTSSGGHVACSRGRCTADWSLSDCQHYLTFDQYEMHLKRLCGRNSKCEKLLRGGGQVCTYYKQKWDSLRMHSTVGNYAFFLSELRYTEDLKQRKLLVCDEAHDLERLLVDFSAFTLKTPSVRQYSAGAGQEFVIPYREGMDSDPAAWLTALEEARKILQAFLDAHEGDLTAQDRLTASRGLLESLAEFTEELKAAPGNWIVCDVRKTTALDANGGSATLVDEVVLKPLEVARYTSKLFDTAEVVLLMSATVFSKELLCKTLGIPEDRAEFVKVAESSFPVENRRVYAMDIVHLSRASMDASLESIAKAVDEIMDAHAGQRGVVHTTSYHQTRSIINLVSERNRARLVTTEGVRARSELLHTHGATEASVLISPSLYQGVDLKDDLSRFQVIVKVPYPDLSDKRTQVKMQRDKGWYQWQTAVRLLQTYGRSVRSETDSAVTYVLDSNFPSFVRDHRELFPQYFLDALSER